MKIKFKHVHDAESIIDSLTAILNMLQEQYDVTDFSNIKLNLTLINELGEEVELIDSTSGEVFDVLEVHKNLEEIDEQLLNDIIQEETDLGTVH